MWRTTVWLTFLVNYETSLLKIKSFETQSLIEKAVSSTKANASTVK